MNIRKIITLLTIAMLTILMLTGCAKTEEKNDKLNIVTTTTMLNDLVKIIGNDIVETQGLCGYGIDPHSYKATAGDIAKMTTADVLIYNGLNLEGKMGDVFSTLESQGKKLIVIENAIDENRILYDEESNGECDPHIWFDIELWKEVAIYVTNELSTIDSDNVESYQENLTNYIVELEELQKYVADRVEEVAQEKRVLITAHDAFNYFGESNGFDVIGLQGVNTQTEASTMDIINLTNLIVENEIKAIFVESSVSSKNIQALQEAVQAKGFSVGIGGELYSDSLGDELTGHNTYITMVKHNIDTIVEGLK